MELEPRASGAMVGVDDKSQLFYDKKASSLSWLKRECT